MYQLYCEEPRRWTPARLAERFGVEIERAEAVVRLMHLQHRQEAQGQAMQHTFSKQMEMLMDAGKREAVRDLRVAKEGAVPIGFDRRADGNHWIETPGVLEEQPSVEPRIYEHQNEREANRRYKFVVADLSSDEVRVRDHDGTLRDATVGEQRMHRHLFPRDVSTETAAIPRDPQTLPRLWVV